MCGGQAPACGVRQRTQEAHVKEPGWWRRGRFAPEGYGRVVEESTGLIKPSEACLVAPLSRRLFGRMNVNFLPMTWVPSTGSSPGRRFPNDCDRELGLLAPGPCPALFTNQMLRFWLYVRLTKWSRSHGCRATDFVPVSPERTKNEPNAVIMNYIFTVLRSTCGWILSKNGNLAHHESISGDMHTR